MRRLPRLPMSVPSLKGPVPVILEVDPRGSDGTECGGYWDARSREIHVDSEVVLAEQWNVLMHELTHMALGDLEVELPDDLEEAICRAMATYLSSQLLLSDAVLVPRRGRAK